MFLLDLRAKKITGKAAEAVLGRAHITVNKNAIPNDPEKPFVTSGIRIGSPAVTTRGFGTGEARRRWPNLIADVLDAPEDDAVIAGPWTAVRRRSVPPCSRSTARTTDPEPGAQPPPRFPTHSNQSPGGPSWLVATLSSSPDPPTYPTACCAR